MMSDNCIRELFLNDSCSMTFSMRFLSFPLYQLNSHLAWGFTMLLICLKYGKSTSDKESPHTCIVSMSDSFSHISLLFFIMAFTSLYKVPMSLMASSNCSFSLVKVSKCHLFLIASGVWLWPNIRY